MQLLYTFILWHLVPLAVAEAVALMARKWWMAGLMFAGWLAGVLVGFLSVWLSMVISEARTGFDAGNAGVMFFCAIPLCTILGMTLGGVWGYTLDHPNRESSSRCSQCGYSLVGLERAGCPECGCGRAS